MNQSVFQNIYTIVSRIPKGKVTTYKQVSVLAKTTPRVVGFALSANKDPKNIPCHRVVSSNGNLTGYAFGGVQKKKELLEKEGVTFLPENHVDLSQSLSTNFI